MIIQTGCNQLYISTLDCAHQWGNSCIGLCIYFYLLYLYENVEMVQTTSFACKMKWSPTDAIFGIWTRVKFKHSLHYFYASNTGCKMKCVHFMGLNHSVDWESILDECLYRNRLILVNGFGYYMTSLFDKLWVWLFCLFYHVTY